MPLAALILSFVRVAIVELGVTVTVTLVLLVVLALVLVARLDSHHINQLKLHAFSLLWSVSSEHLGFYGRPM